MGYRWDETKRQANLAKHGVDFATAEQFDFDGAVRLVDDRFEYGETREIAYGYLDRRLFVLVFTRRGSDIHVISFRKANKREIRSYG